MADIITYGGIKFLRHKESYEVRKGKMEIIIFYTRLDTGESGMSLRSLANACGTALSPLQKFLEEKTAILAEVTSKQDDCACNDLNTNEKEVTSKSSIYLILHDDVHVILDIYCERIIRYYAYESRYKKTKARELHAAFAQHGIRDFIQGKTGYQANLAPQHDIATVLSIEEQLRKENEELKLRLVDK
ncbi:hypothetical protein TI03_05560, partial [Achromatium sp. WMS1]